MQKITLGISNLEAGIIGLGTWAIGGGPWWGDNNDAESLRAIHAALDAGVNLIDTAPLYGFGHSEQIVGQAIQDRREQVLLATKVGLWWDDARGSYFFEQAGHTVRRCLRPETIRIEVENSLRRLATDYIDLYQTHWQCGTGDVVAIADTMECLMRLREEGKIREIGASNTTLSQIEEYLATGELITVQERYSMLDRYLEHDMLPFCRAENLGVLAYSPLEQGLLTGSIGMDVQLDPTSYRNEIPWFAPENREHVLDMLWGWEDLCETYNCTLGQLVIAWTAQQPGISVVLCGARRAAHVRENVRAGELHIKELDLERMRQDVELLGEPKIAD